MVRGLLRRGPPDCRDGSDLELSAADTAFIGLFMTAHDRQGADWPASSGTAWPGCLPPGITGCGWRWMRAILRAWPSGPRTASPSPVRSTPMIFSAYLPMERGI